MGFRADPGTIDQVASSVSDKVTWTGAFTGLLGWFAQVNWIGLVGAVVAVGGLAANVYFQHRRDKREAAESAARIAALQDKCDV
jgi:uncharacterized membrane protein YebE (DUF533 family)